MRVEWAPLDRAIAVCVGGLVEIHDRTEVRVHSRDVLDMRWLADGQLLTIDARGVLQWTQDGRVIEQHQRLPERARMRLIAATLGGNGDRFVAIDRHEDSRYFEISIVTAASRTIYRPVVRHIDHTKRVSAAISRDGRVLALGYIARQNNRIGRAVCTSVFDVDRDRSLERGSYGRATRGVDPPALALDDAGTRLARAGSDAGVTRVGRDDREVTAPSPTALVATAVALEGNGAIAAYAARNRLRFDYLDDEAEVVDTQILEVERADPVALAFSNDRRRLACVSAAGVLEIVPVP